MKTFLIFSLVLTLSACASTPDVKRSMASTSEVYRLTEDSEIGGVFDNCDFQTGKCNSTQGMKSGRPKQLILQRGQLVWVSHVNGNTATVHFIANKERSLSRYGTLDISLLQAVSNCQVSDLLELGTCP